MIPSPLSAIVTNNMMPPSQVLWLEMKCSSCTKCVIKRLAIRHVVQAIEWLTVVVYTMYTRRLWVHLQCHEICVHVVCPLLCEFTK